MIFRELSVGGVLFSPLVPVALASWVVVALLRRILRRVGLLSGVWHPALVTASAFVLLLCLALRVLVIAPSALDGR